MEGLRGIVSRQAEAAKKTMATAKGAQEQSIIDVNSMVKNSTMLVIIIGVIAVAFGIGFGAWIYRSISRPLARLISATDEIASGNLKHEITASANDEIGRVEASVAKMVQNLKEIVGKIRLAASGLASSSDELSATARSLDQGSGEQAAQVEQAAGAMVEMSQTTDEVAKNALKTSEAAKSMKKIALDGKGIVHSSGGELGRFVETVNESAKEVESLGKNSEEVQSIVDLIKEIADQTNLLALLTRAGCLDCGEDRSGSQRDSRHDRKDAEGDQKVGRLHAGAEALRGQGVGADGRDPVRHGRRGLLRGKGRRHGRPYCRRHGGAVVYRKRSHEEHGEHRDGDAPAPGLFHGYERHVRRTVEDSL